VTSEIEGYQDQLLSIVQDAPGIFNGLARGEFYWRPPGGGWSIGDCFEHLNLTAKLFAGPIEHTIHQARADGLVSPGPFSYRLIERLFVRAMEPPPRMRLRARPGFRPEDMDRPAQDPGGQKIRRPPDVVVADFSQWQERLKDLLQMADGVDLRRARLRSPVLPAFTYNLGTCLAATLAHERRHLWQARLVRTHPAFPLK